MRSRPLEMRENDLIYSEFVIYEEFDSSGDDLKAFLSFVSNLEDIDDHYYKRTSWVPGRIGVTFVKHDILIPDLEPEEVQIIVDLNLAGFVGVHKYQYATLANYTEYKFLKDM